MGMISKSLEATLSAALREARSRRHEYLCTEHLLYAILDDAYGKEILHNCGVIVSSLRKSLEEFFANELDRIPDGARLNLQQTESL